MTRNRTLPDFIIIGARKCGTTSLYNWLRAQPELFLPSTKEPAFFSREEKWNLGLEWYTELFAAAEDDQLTGEASAGYTSPEFCAIAAERMASTVPASRLIFLVRHPLDMVRSQYRHQSQRRRERQPLISALLEPDNPYLRHSMYHSCLSPYLGRFHRSQICVVRLEDLVSEDATGWEEILRHLGLSVRPRPTSTHNVSADKPVHGRGFEFVARWMSPQVSANLPGPVRKAGRALLTSNSKTRDVIEASEVEIPPHLIAPVWEDIYRLEEWLGRPLWEDAPR